MLVTTAAAVVGQAPPATAGAEGQPIVADVTGDRRPDLVVLDERVPVAPRPGARQVRICDLVVRPGLPSGGFGAPQRHPYLTLPSQPTYCPNMGTLTNFAADPAHELVVAWSGGRPPGVDYDLLTVDNFRPVGFSDALEFPSFVGSADFTGEGVLDVYEWSDQGEGFATFVHTGAGDFEPGVQRWCAEPRSVRFADFDRDRAQGAVLSYIAKCDDLSSGVVLIDDSGTVWQFQHDPEGFTTWTVETLDANGDGLLDVRTVNDVTGQVDTFLGLGDATFVQAPLAVQDKLTVSATRKTDIPVLANDYASSTAEVTIVQRPRYGTVQVTSRRTIVYDPDRRTGRTDRFVYRVSEGGRSSNASVNLDLVD